MRHITIGSSVTTVVTWYGELEMGIFSLNFDVKGSNSGSGKPHSTLSLKEIIVGDKKYVYLIKKKKK